MSDAAVSTIVIDNWYDNPDAIRRHALMRIEAEGTTGASKRSLESMRDYGPKWEPYPGTRCKAEMGNLAWNYDMMQRVVGCEIDPLNGVSCRLSILILRWLSLIKKRSNQSLETPRLHYQWMLYLMVRLL